MKKSGMKKMAIFLLGVYGERTFKIVQTIISHMNSSIFVFICIVTLLVLLTKTEG